MKIMNIWDDLQGELERYRTSSAIIRQYLRLYEEECNILIDRIAESYSFDDAQVIFNDLHKIQREISMIKNKFEFPLNDRLRDFVYYMDRDDSYSRKYWYEKFKKGIKWPDE